MVENVLSANIIIIYSDYRQHKIKITVEDKGIGPDTREVEGQLTHFTFTGQCQLVAHCSDGNSTGHSRTQQRGSLHSLKLDVGY